MARGVQETAAQRRHRSKRKPAAKTKPRAKAKTKAKTKPKTTAPITRRAAQRLIARNIGVRDPNRVFEPIERDPSLLSLVIEAAPSASTNALHRHLEQVYGDVILERLFPDYRAGEDIPSLRNYYVATLPAVSLSSLIANPHDIAYAAIEKGMVESAEPDTPGRAVSAACKDWNAPKHHDKRWSLQQMRVPKAWEKLSDAGKDRGGGVTIGQLDTGITNHALLFRQTNPIGGYDEIRHSNGGVDPLPDANSARGEFTGHGTQTASIISAEPGNDDGEMSGVAPDAKLEPIRVSRSVVLLSPSIVAQGIDRAVRQNCDILSISLGGVTGTGVWAAIRNAYARNLLICCAAGQCEPVVVCPALYPQSIAVGGSRFRLNPLDGRFMEDPWTRSAWGALDICAPAESVWNADATGPELTRSSQGTSFAAPAVAAIGALWLRFHDDKGLKARYRWRKALNHVFAQVVENSARRTRDWPTTGWGPGIVDAEAVLNARLPPPGPLIPMPQFLLDHDPPDLFALFERIFWDQPAAAIRAVLGRMFGAANPEALRDLLQQYGGELTRLVQQTEENFERVRDAVAAEAQGQADRAAEAAHHVAQSASDKLRSVFG